MKQNSKRRVALTMLLIGGLLLVNWYNRPWFTQPERAFYANREAAEAVVEQYLATGMVPHEEMDGISAVYAWPGKNPIIEFTTSSSGLVSSSTYRGFYYSINDVPTAYQGGEEQLYPNDEGWWDWYSVGDNGGHTKSIEGNWYVFEAHF